MEISGVPSWLKARLAVGDWFEGDLRVGEDSAGVLFGNPLSFGNAIRRGDRAVALQVDADFPSGDELEVLRREGEWSMRIVRAGWPSPPT